MLALLDKGEFVDHCCSCNGLTSVAIMHLSALDIMLQNQFWLPGCGPDITNLEAPLQPQKQGMFPGYIKQTHLTKPNLWLPAAGWFVGPSLTAPAW